MASSQYRDALIAASTADVVSQTHAGLQSQKEQPVWFKTYMRALSNSSIVPNPHFRLASHAMFVPHNVASEKHVQENMKMVKTITTVREFEDFAESVDNAIVIFLDPNCEHCQKLMRYISSTIDIHRLKGIPSHIAVTYNKNGMFFGLTPDKLSKTLGIQIFGFPHAIYAKTRKPVAIQILRNEIFGPV